MKVQVLFFARARDLGGGDSIEIEVTAPATLADLRTVLAERLPALGGLLPRSVLALNGELVQESSHLADGDAVALLPPVSGGGQLPELT